MNPYRQDHRLPIESGSRMQYNPVDAGPKVTGPADVPQGSARLLHPDGRWEALPCTVSSLGTMAFAMPENLTPGEELEVVLQMAYPQGDLVSSTISLVVSEPTPAPADVKGEDLP